MTWDPLQEPPGPQPGPYIEYSAFGPATGPQMPPPAAGAEGAWGAAGPAGAAAPLSLWEAVKQLPAQYWRILSKPGTATFAAEAGKARWDIIWAQVLGFSLISALLVLALWLVEAAIFGAILASVPTPSGESNPFPIVSIFFVPVPFILLTALIGGVGGFFLGEGIFYLLARAFGGQGDFKTQAYTSLLIRVPVGIGAALLSLIPFVGAIGSLAAIYAYVLQAFQLMAVHRLSTGKAIAVVLIPVGVGLLLGILLTVAFFIFFFNIINALPAPQYPAT